MEPVIELINLTKRYQNFTAVDSLNLTLYRGEVFGLLGPNGAGKTTTILMMLGLTERSEGEVKVLGFDPNYDALAIKSKVGYMPDDIGFYEDRTAIDNIVYTARLNGIPVKEATKRAEQLLKRVGLENAAYKRVGSFSRGMRQRLGLADVLIKQPQIIILDEPTLGIDPEGVRELLQLISELSKEEKITVLLSSHHLHQVQQVCDRVGLFVQGKLVACGNIEELSAALDEEQTVTIQLEVDSLNNTLKQKLEEIEQVLQLNIIEVKSASQQVQLTCSEDITPEIAKLVSQHAKLYMIQRRVYGLDDIYHRYFEGGEKREAAAKA